MVTSLPSYSYSTASGNSFSAPSAPLPVSSSDGTDSPGSTVPSVFSEDSSASAVSSPVSTDSSMPPELLPPGTVSTGASTGDGVPDGSSVSSMPDSGSG